MNVSYLSGIPKRKTVSVVSGFSTDKEYGVFNVNLDNACKAVLERMLYVKGPSLSGFVRPPVPTQNSYRDRLENQLEYVKKHAFAATPLTKEQFLGSYEGRRRAMYENAYESLNKKSLTVKDSYIQWFLKCEKVHFTEVKEAVPRGISPRSPRYHVSIGPYIKRIEKEIYKVLAKMFKSKHTVFKGLNAAVRGHNMRLLWDDFKDPVAIGLDASRFDQHVSEEALDFEHQVYKLFYPRDKRFSMYLEWQKKNKCFVNLVEARFKFVVHGRRMSGDMNTALGNCLLMSVLVHAYLESVSVRGKLANDGDDCVLIIEKRDLERLGTLSEWFLEMGFNMKVETPVCVFEEIEFCQAKPVWTPDGWIMVRNPHTSIPKDCISIKPLNTSKLARRWMRAVGQCGMSLTGGIPVVQQFYQSFIDVAGNVKSLANDPTMETGMKYLAVGMHRNYHEPHWMTRVSFFRAFGIDPDKQILIESTYRDRVSDFNPTVDPKNSGVKDIFL